jgi:Ca2+-binding EF-hand superfamily protein
MNRIVSFATLCALFVFMSASAQDTKKDPPKKIPPQVEEILKLTPEEVIKRFDKNGDGKLSKDELPAIFGKAFDAADKNGDGKLDRAGVAAMQTLLRNVFAAGNQPKTPPAKDIEKFIDGLLKQFDKDGDGKISRKEATGPFLADNFDQLDLNKDGFLDRKELRAMAERMQANQKGNTPKTGFGGPMYDFDALDKNVDGRLTKEELKGTPLYDRFAEIDTDKNGQIDRREFEAFLERESAKAKK